MRSARTRPAPSTGRQRPERTRRKSPTVSMSSTYRPSGPAVLGQVASRPVRSVVLRDRSHRRRAARGRAGASVEAMSDAQPPKFEAACSAESPRPAVLTSRGTHLGNARVITLWVPFRVWTSQIAASLSLGNRFARRTRAGQTRRWTKVTLPLTARHVSTSGESRTDRVNEKMLCDCGCDHQFPLTGSPAMNSTRLGTGP